jgi:hypothetical protein
MKTIASLAAAGLIAATSLASTTVTADAGGKHWKGGNNYHNHYYYKRDNGWNSGAALATGAILGLSIGALAAPRYYAPPPPPPVYYEPPPPDYGYYGGPTAQHISWCESRYRSYDPRNNSFVGYDGYIHQCVSPF